MRPWTRPRRQLAHCRAAQLGPLSDGCLWQQPDGRLRVGALAQNGLLLGLFEAGGRLNRSLHYFAGVRLEDGGARLSRSKQLLAVVRADGVVEVQRRRAGSFVATQPPTELGRAGEQVALATRWLDWVDEGRLLVVAQVYDEVRMTLWDVATRQVLRVHECAALALRSVAVLGTDLFWLPSGAVLRSSRPEAALDDVRALFKLSEGLLLAVRGGREWTLVGCVGGRLEMVPVGVPGSADFVHGFAHAYAGHGRVLYVDSAGWQWLATFGTAGAGAAGVPARFIRFSEGLHQTPIEDVWFGRAVVVVLRATSVAVHDSASMRLLEFRSVQSRPRHQQARADAEAEAQHGPFTKRLLQVDEEHGWLLVQWGASSIQVWNYGAPLAGLEPAARAAGRPQPSRKALGQQIRSEYADWRAEKDEELALERLRERLNPAGLDEEELVAMAMALSATLSPDAGQHSHGSAGDAASDDEELRLVLERSRLET